MLEQSNQKSSDRIKEKLDASRKELLDLGLRNPLLNHIPPRARGIAVVDGESGNFFQLLVKENKSLSFQPQAEANEKSDGKILAPLGADRLRDVLLRAFYTARTGIEEQGINTLFLALGALSWKDEEEFHRAPLLLVPVELTRSTARERFALRYTGEDFGPNLSLMTKLRAEYGIYLPEMGEVEDLDPAAYFAAVNEAVRVQDGWTVEENTVFLDFFSFGKFLMYADLDEERWPAGSKPTEHSIVRSLLEEGFREPSSRFSEKDDLDQASAEVRCVLDADSSQILAMLDVMDGRNLIIQGPPGTGKSQTIANILAEAIGRGKKILFVAEKAAALEVVKRRLDQIGLGDACLELHSHKTNKKSLLKEISRTLNLGKPSSSGFARNLPILEETKKKLSSYCQAINSPIGPFTPYQAMGELLRLRRENPDLPSFPLDVEGWSEEDWTRRLNLVEELENHLNRMGDFGTHPFSGVGRTVFLPSDKERLLNFLAEAKKALAFLRGAASELAETLGMSVPGSRLECRSLLDAAHWAIETVDLGGVALDTPEWETIELAALEEVFEAGTALQALMARFGKIVLPEVWDSEHLPTRDLLEIRQHLAAYGRKWWGGISGDYRKSLHRLAGLCIHHLPASFPERMKLVDVLLEARRKRKFINASVASKLFSSHWKGENSDWDKLRAISLKVIDLRARSEKIFLVELDPQRKEEALQRILQLEKEMEDSSIHFCSDFLQLEVPLVDLPFVEQAEAISHWAEKIDSLDALTRFNRLAENLRSEKLEEILALAKSSASTQLVAAFQQNAFRCLLESAFGSRPALSRFDGGSHQEAIERFKSLDELLLQHHQVELAEAHWKKLPRHEASGQLGVLRHEFEKKSRHMSIRQMMIKAGRAIQEIKPVFLMSPLSVATFLAPDGISFDLVVFDEASQVKPVDAFGAILRGKQVVVVGDKKQLPPTDFFEKVDRSEESETVTSDIESILGLFDSKGAPSRMLRWHYRSRHESLIAVSNREFYDSRLVIFPSPDRSREDAGLIYHPVPEAVYDLGNTRTNPIEAQAVADAVMEHARLHPELTLGVAAFSVAQMEAIQDRVERMRREHPEEEGFFAAHPHEPFFIKNLETVQGDERDAIMISVGYGKAADGHLSMNFGPLNRTGGERRLNVLFTRARLRCEVFTNLSAQDIDLERSEASGVRSLKRFLSYAAQGDKKMRKEGESAKSSLFEEEIRGVLVEQGYAVESNVGVSGIYFDLAVVDPESPGRYLLGIECDGPSYRVARSSRDRDRLRHQVLEGLNWRIHQVWSADWLFHTPRETAALIEAVEKAKIKENEKSEKLPSRSRTALRRELQSEGLEENDDIIAYRCAGDLPKDLKDIPLDQLVVALVRVVDVEGPIHFSEIDRRLADAANLKRIPVLVQAELDAARLHSVKTGVVLQKQDFFHSREKVEVVLRDRSRLAAASRRLELVDHGEIFLAISKVAGDSCGIEWERLPSAVCRILGVRPSDEASTVVGALALTLIEEGRLEERAGYLQIVQ